MSCAHPCTHHGKIANLAHYLADTSAKDDHLWYGVAIGDAGWGASKVGTSHRPWANEGPSKNEITQRVRYHAAQRSERREAALSAVGRQGSEASGMASVGRGRGRGRYFQLRKFP